MSAVCLELNQQRDGSFAFIEFASVSHREVTCQLSALPLKAQTGPKLHTSVTVALNNSPVLWYYLCWLTLHMVPWKLLLQNQASHL